MNIPELESMADAVEAFGEDLVFAVFRREMRREIEDSDIAGRLIVRRLQAWRKKKDEQK